MDPQVQTNSSIGNPLARVGEKLDFDTATLVVIGGKLALGIVIFIIAMLIGKIVGGRIASKIKDSIVGDDQHMYKVGDLVGSIISTGVTFAGVLIALTVIGIDFSMFLGGLSIGIGFGLKTILENFVSGILVLTTKEFTLGDIIEIQGKYNIVGKVEELNIRYTVIRTFDLRRVVIPNIELISNPIKTFTSEETIRLESVFTVSHSQQLGPVEEAVREAINTLPFVKNKANTIIGIHSFNEYGTVMRVLYFCDASFEAAMGVVQSQVSLAIKQHLESRNIGLSYPHVTVDPSSAYTVSLAS